MPRGRVFSHATLLIWQVCSLEQFWASTIGCFKKSAIFWCVWKSRDGKAYLNGWTTPSKIPNVWIPTCLLMPHFIPECHEIQFYITFLGSSRQKNTLFDLPTCWKKTSHLLATTFLQESNCIASEIHAHSYSMYMACTDCACMYG